MAPGFPCALSQALRAEITNWEEWPFTSIKTKNELLLHVVPWRGVVTSNGLASLFSGSLVHLNLNFIFSSLLGDLTPWSAFLYSVVVQLLSHIQLFVTPWTVVRQASLSLTNSQTLLKLMSIESVMPSNHLILCHPLLLLPSIFPIIKVFSSESVVPIRWPKYWSFNFSISPSNEYSGWISFRMDWFDLLAVQGTLKSLLQHHSSKASIFWHSAYLMVQV